MSCSVALVGFGCGQDVKVGIDVISGAGGTSLGGGGGAGALGGEPGRGGAPEGGAPDCIPIQCEGMVKACGNCDDDDGDGLIDALDPECLGPCDNDEAGLSSGLSGNTSNTCRQDCYFDSDDGAGNDQCLWSQACDERSVAPDYPPSGEARCAYVEGAAPMGVACEAALQTQSDTCLERCLPLVPNGCDCFGCCELPARSGNSYYIGRAAGADGCQLDRLDDPAVCPPCTQVPGCKNPCERCEACVGGSPEDDCDPAAACEADNPPCPDGRCGVGRYCVTGCCILAPPK